MLAFVDTLIVSFVLSIGAIVILIIMPDLSFYAKNIGIYAMLNSFSSFNKVLGYIFMIVVFFFGFSTLTGNGFYVESGLSFLFKKVKKIHLIQVYCATLLLTSFLNAKNLIDLIDFLSYLILIPNIFSILYLSNVVKNEVKKFKSSQEEASDVNQKPS